MRSPRDCPLLREAWGAGAVATCEEGKSTQRAVDAGSPLPPADLQRLYDRAAALPTLHRIDLLDLNSIGQPLRDAILAEGVVL